MKQASPFRFHLVALVAALALAGCSSTKLDTDVPVESRIDHAGRRQRRGRQRREFGRDHAEPGHADRPDQEHDDRGVANLPRIVYFDFDSYVVKDEYRPTVEANAKALAADRKRKIAVEGHTDERGGREYNLALGQKRAEAVAKSLTLAGRATTARSRRSASARSVRRCRAATRRPGPRTAAPS